MKTIKLLKNLFTQIHSAFWWILENILPLLVTIVFMMLLFIALVAIGVKFDSQEDLVLTILCVGVFLFLFLYDVVEILLKELISWCIYMSAFFYWQRNSYW